MGLDALLSPVSMGDLRLPNRVLMAPLTRSRSRQPGDVPQEVNARYYAQRASAGLLIAEATQISPQGKGYAFTPGIYSDEHVAGWRGVTRAVHARGGRIVLQLWHVGRVSHTALQPGGVAPVAPSAIRGPGKTYTSAESGMVELSEPRALRTEEIPQIVADYRRAAERAKEAGFDGVEIHGANGYLIDQFTRDGTNHRTDAYGGSVENRTRFGVEVAQAVVGVWGAGRVGYRVSPLGAFNGMSDRDPAATFGRLAERLGALGLAYLHAVEAMTPADRTAEAEAVFSTVREKFRRAGGQAYIGNGALTPEEAARRVEHGQADAIAFGKLFISNPDLPTRIARGGPYNEWDQASFYGGTEKGYTDYPALADVV